MPAEEDQITVIFPNDNYGSADEYFKPAVKVTAGGSSSGVSSIGGASGAILLGDGLQMDSNTLKALGGGGTTLLWKNANQRSKFSGQSIYIETSETYGLFAISFWLDINMTMVHRITFLLGFPQNGYKNYCRYVTYGANGTNDFAREINCWIATDKITISVSDGIHNGGSPSNQYMIPCEIYGIK